MPLKVIVRGDWLSCQLNLDATINIVCGNMNTGILTIDDENNYLVTEPDVLISTTVLADSFACLRRAVLSYRTQPSVEDNKPSASLICGSIVHELVEEAFRTGNFANVETVLKPLDSLIVRQIESIACCDHDEQFVRNKVVEMMQSFPDWCKLYLRKIPAPQSYVHDQVKAAAPSSVKTMPSKTEKQTICLSKVLDLEENIWSVAFGLKGKVDATVLLKYKSAKDYVHLVAPFELKTGSSTTSISHRAQTLLYTLLLFDRYRRPIDYGLLFYISTGDLMRVPAWRDEIRSILIARNRLASELGNGSLADAHGMTLPAQIKNEHLCKRCFQVDACVMYHRLAEHGTSSTSSTPSLFETKTAHLAAFASDALGAFFRKWQHLVSLEEQETIACRSILWRCSATERAKAGRCFNEMVLVSCTAVELEDGQNPGGMARFRCIFKKTGQEGPDDGLAQRNVQLNEGDPVVISQQFPMLQYGLAIGFVQSLASNCLAVLTDRPLREIPLPSEPIEEVASVASSFGQLQINNSSHDRLFTVDKDELTSSFGLLRANLYKLFTADSSKLLDLIVNLKAPTFSALKEQALFDNKLLEEHHMLSAFLLMDEFQRAAVKRVIESRDYLLILGMPGTGKTTTLAFAIQYLVKILGRSVLISSHTHSAIDHIALKLQESNVPLVRVGNETRIDKKIHGQSILANQSFKTVAEVEHYYASAQVVICTSLGINQ